MQFDQKKFASEIPSAFFPLQEELARFGYVPTLVGGSVRDFFLTGTLGKDWDLELSHETIPFNKNDWKDLGKSLSQFGKMTFLPYEIIRIEAGDYQFEFSPPRTETFFEDKYHHSNFTADFDLKMPFEKAILRRDFTINAMGVRIKSKKEMEFLDPAEGLKHLHSKVLHPVGPDFAKDPVRYLRAHRFGLKLGFDLSQELKEILSKMKLIGITSAYLWSEMQKSGRPADFLERLIKDSNIHPEFSLPLDFNDIPKFKDLKHLLVNPTKHESWIVSLEWVEISSERWRNFFSVSSDSGRKLARWAQSSRIFQKIMPENFHGEFEEVVRLPDFDKLFDWYFSTKQLLQKFPDLPLLKMIDDFLPEWVYLYRFEAPKDVKHIDPPLRAKYQVWNLCQRL